MTKTGNKPQTPDIHELVMLHWKLEDDIRKKLKAMKNGASFCQCNTEEKPTVVLPGETTKRELYEYCLDCGGLCPQ